MADDSLTLAGAWVYPLKGAGPMAVTEGALDTLGLPQDRRWMLVTDEGDFISQRTHPRLALLSLSEGDGEGGGWAGSGIESDPGFCVEGPGMKSRVLRVPESSDHRMRVRVHRDTFEAQPCREEEDDWFSAFLGERCRLVYFASDVLRPTDPTYAPGHRTTFTDGYPLHLVTGASLRDLNHRLDNEVGVDRFRPNLLVEGAEPWEEDEWRVIDVGGARLELVKPCARCSVTLVHPENARVESEPLAALSRFREWEGKVFFGQNAIVSRPGSFETGSTVRIVERGERRPPIRPSPAPLPG